jgi:SAM-dependent methyltransferase
MTLRSMALSSVAMDAPAIDVGCGDGIFSFLHAGGALDPDFDVFLSAGSLDRVTDEHADMFDCDAAEYAPRAVRPPGWRIRVGSDLKPTLLRKARALYFYDELVEHDSNRPLPYSSGRFATVYTNAAYWVREIAPFLRELRRVTRPGGRVVLQVKLAEMSRYTLERFRPQLGERFLEIIGRGRWACWPTVASRAEWERRFDQAGLKVLEAAPLATRTHAHLWDVGLRPIAPLLVRMANAISPATRAAIKRDWVELFMDLLEPITRADFELFAGNAEAAEIQYVLTPG